MPPTLKEVIQSHRASNTNDPVAFKAYLLTQAEEMLENMLTTIVERKMAELKEMSEQMREEAREMMKEATDTLAEETVNTLTRVVKKGDKGDSIIGPKGETGDRGEQGLPGKNGKNGLNGLDGLSGTDGKDGKDGKDGSPDTSEQIAYKLNGKHLLEKSAIKGLEEALKKTSSVTRIPSGGGVGNPQHETFSVSSATTSIRTAFPVAANGFFVFAFYQGQLIVRGTHYTVDSDRRTLPLTFTPQDSTNIDLIYIRA